MADAASAAEGAVVELTWSPVMTPAEAERYMAAHPQFAAKVDAHARELAARLDLHVGNSPPATRAPAPREALADVACCPGRVGDRHRERR